MVNGVNHEKDSLEEIIFDDGTIWTEATLLSRIIDGTPESDTLDGTADGDLLTGFKGDDLLTGGSGSDTFVFNGTKFGNDTISDFQAGSGTDDVIAMNAFTSFDDVLTAMSDDGTDTTLTINGNNSITLEGVLTNDLHQDDFQFM